MQAWWSPRCSADLAQLPPASVPCSSWQQRSGAAWYTQGPQRQLYGPCRSQMKRAVYCQLLCSAWACQAAPVLLTGPYECQCQCSRAASSKLQRNVAYAMPIEAALWALLLSPHAVDCCQLLCDVQAHKVHVCPADWSAVPPTLMLHSSWQQAAGAAWHLQGSQRRLCGPCRFHVASAFCCQLLCRVQAHWLICLFS